MRILYLLPKPKNNELSSLQAVRNEQPRHCEGGTTEAICTIEFQTKRLLHFIRSDEQPRHCEK